MGSGLFGFWLRFRSVTGHCGHAPSLKPRQKPKILAPHGHRISGKAQCSLRLRAVNLRGVPVGWQAAGGAENDANLQGVNIQLVLSSPVSASSTLLMTAMTGANGQGSISNYGIHVFGHSIY
jgi:hypothetical protein